MNAFEEVISGMVISVIMVPETLAYGYLLGLPPSTAIHSSMVMGFVTSLFGTPALISGAAASIATNLIGVTRFCGKEYIPLTVVLGGMIQILLGLTGLYKYLLHISPSVNSGFLITLALMIGTSQVENLTDVSGNALHGDALHNMFIFVLIGLFVIQYGYLVLHFSRNKSFRIPGSVLEIILISLFLYLFPVSMKKVDTSSKTLPSLDVGTLWKQTSDMKNVIKVLPFSFAMAISGLIESLIMVQQQNEKLGLHSSYTREVVVQGLANILSGLTGGMGGCVLVGESLLNMSYGNTSRLSSITANACYILWNTVFGKAIAHISMSSIVAIMLYISYLTGDWAALTQQQGHKLHTTLATVLSGYASNSLTLGVIVGSVFEKVKVLRAPEVE